MSFCLQPSWAADRKTKQTAPPKDAPHWDYEKHGPAEWGNLAPEFAVCGNGKSQSPIDIAYANDSATTEIQPSYKPAALQIIHTGHSIQVNYTDGDAITIGYDKFLLLQYHFHSPSEHTIKGKHSPLEMHLVHMTIDKKKIAVISVMIDEGSENKAFRPIWDYLPKRNGVEHHLVDIPVDINHLLPNRKAAYRYEGSLTTPPCSEGVQWVVMKHPVELSMEQIDAFRKILKGNNRPTQPLNGRAVYSDKVRD